MSINVLGQSYASEVQALAALKIELERLEAQQRAKEEERLKNLAGEFGVDSVDALILRLAGYASRAMRNRIEGTVATKAAPVRAPASVRKARGTRTRVTPELREQIVAAINAGTTSAGVAAQFGVSVPTVHNVKKAAGLTKARANKG